MGLMDKMKAQAEVGLAKANEASKVGLAKAAEVSKAGQAKLDEAQAKRRADTLLRSLGFVVYAEHAGRGTAQSGADRERLIEEIGRYEAEYGPIAS